MGKQREFTFNLFTMGAEMDRLYQLYRSGEGDQEKNWKEYIAFINDCERYKKGLADIEEDIVE